MRRTSQPCARWGNARVLWRAASEVHIVRIKEMLTNEISLQFRRTSAGFVAIFLCCRPFYGQVNEKPRMQPSYAQVSRKPDLSELAEDNYSRVAASSAQIREVLLMDTGLLVELKRWVAKEATDNGQIVEDQN